MPRGNPGIGEIHRAWRLAHPGKWRAIQAKGWATMAERSRAALKGVAARQARSLRDRDVPVTLARVTLVDGG